MRLFPLFFMLMAAIAPIGHVHAQSATHSEHSARLAAANALVEVMEPPKVIEVGMSNVLAAIETQLKAAPEILEMEKSKPGISKVMVESMRQLYKIEVDRIQPLRQRELAELYARNLTVVEIEYVKEFMSSPDGVLLLEMVADNSKFNSSMGEVRQKIEANGNIDDGVIVSHQSIRKDMMAAGMRTVRQLPSRTLQKFGVFQNSPAGRKFLALNSQKMEINVKWFNIEPSADFNKAVEEAMIEAFVNYTVDADAKISQN